MASGATLIVVAHGRLPGALQSHAASMCRDLRAAGHSLYVLRVLSDGVPTHPLARGKGHVAEDSQPVLWNRMILSNKVDGNETEGDERIEFAVI